MLNLGAAIGRIWKYLAGESLVHFVLLGTVIFGVYAFFQRDAATEPPPTEIRLTVDDLAQLLIVFESQWRRQPTQDEFNTMVEDRVRQDILYREALALGLDREDTIVKRRMAQKMQFIAEDVAAAREPTDNELRTWFAANSELFDMPARYSFRHLYFSPDIRGSRAQEDAERTLSKLSGLPPEAKVDTSLADPFMFQDYYADRTSQAIARDFGPEFAAQIGKLKAHLWQGPVKSGFGWHLVFVESVEPGRIPAFEEVEQDVKTAWLGKQKEAAWQEAYAKMRAKYKVLLPIPAKDAIEQASTSAVQPTKRAADSDDAL